MKTILAAALVAMPSAALAAAKPARLPACPITRTIYAQPGNPGVTAGFAKPAGQINYATDLVFWLSADGQTFWYRLSSPNGYGGLYITPQLDPALIKPRADGEGEEDRLPGMIPAEGEEEEDFQMMFDAFDTQMVVMPSPPTSKDKAPALLWARELGPLFHYAHAGGIYKITNPVRVDIAFWRPVKCAPVSGSR